jgi:NDP-sugar pyrophosphorylase family protein
LTLLRPKVLCPVDNHPLVDHAIARMETVTSSVAVNIHHGRDLMESHLAGRVHLSVEEPVPLGTAGALGALRDWIAGRPVVVVNGDSWTPRDGCGLDALLAGWDGGRTRVLVEGGGELRPASRVVASLMPWSVVERLPAEPSGLYETAWRASAANGGLETVAYDGVFFDCGAPASYLGANLAASGGSSVIGPGAIVDGTLAECVVWPGAVVRAGEHLTRAIRAHDRMTVLVR